ncbi:MAG: MerR family transcriptional regulator, partial [Gammaproteobacteria bacterium]|nr:MerR family transcriptional regulator [Gammaproteobacteria bacterium]
PHVLRYWEQEFAQLKPVKRRGNRRYYQRQDVILIRQIRALLYEQGFTIGGARLRMSGQNPVEPEEMPVKVAQQPMVKNEAVREMIEEIEEALGYLS